MKKAAKFMVSLLSVMVILNIQVSSISAKSLNNKTKNIVTIQNDIGHTYNCIDPDSERKD